MNYENYPALPAKPFMELHKDFCPVVYEGWATQIRDAQKETVQACVNAIMSAASELEMSSYQRALFDSAAILKLRFGLDE